MVSDRSIGFRVDADASRVGKLARTTFVCFANTTNKYCQGDDGFLTIFGITRWPAHKDTSKTRNDTYRRAKKELRNKKEREWIGFRLERIFGRLRFRDECGQDSNWVLIHSFASRVSGTYLLFVYSKHMLYINYPSLESEIFFERWWWWWSSLKKGKVGEPTIRSTRKYARVVGVRNLIERKYAHDPS